MSAKSTERILHEGRTPCPLLEYPPHAHHWRMFGGMNIFGTYELLSHCTGCMRVLALDIVDEE